MRIARTAEECDRLFAAFVKDGHLDGLVSLYERGACLVQRDGTVAVGHDQLRSALATLTTDRTEMRMRIVQVVTCDDVAALVVAIALAAFEITLGFKALASPRGTINGVPFFMLFFLATITTLAAAGDIRVMGAGPLRAGPRLARHLWRMCFALFIAAGSFFSIRARVARIFPAPFTTPTMRGLPVVLVFVAMFYWLWRVRGRRTFALAR
jgi:hypothetical protein